jgi:hypothetical protein
MILRVFSYIILSVVLLLSSCIEERQEIFLSDVFSYTYAPGQHASSALNTDIRFIKGNPALHNGWLFLGGFGGNVVAGFPVNVTNHEGEDFEVFALKGAGPEPAIVYVMQDKNNNGQPDDQWYELKGNQFENTDRDYQLTYYKPASANGNISWKDNKGGKGELIPGFGASNSSSWWWTETHGDSIVFSGSKLPDAYEKKLVGDVEIWQVPNNKFLWGYAENQYGTDYDSETGINKLDISNAVDDNGNAVSLPHIRFIKIQSAVFQQAGMINEVSSEIRGARVIQKE